MRTGILIFLAALLLGLSACTSSFSTAPEDPELENLKISAPNVIQDEDPPPPPGGGGGGMI